MRGYTTVLTGWAGAVIAFDILWMLTEMDIIEVFFVALCIGIFVATGFIFLTEYLTGDRKTAERPTYTRDEETGLEFMQMRNGRSI